MIEILAHIALAVGFFALGYVVRREQEPEAPPPEAPYKLEPPSQAVKVVGRRGGRELPDVNPQPWKPS